MQFTKYQHLERLGTTEVEGIEVGEVYVFPKLDGTNASVWVDAEGNLKAGSRNRTLSVESDNAGFCKWVLDNEDKFRPFFDLYPHKILYGEWLVPHSLTTYREDAWRKFYIFDVYEEQGPTHYLDYSPILNKFGLEYLAPIAIIRNGSDEHFRKCLDKNTYLIEEGKGTGEGVVLKNYSFVNRFGRTTWAKIVANHFKEVHYKKMGPPEIGGMTTEEKIVNEFVSQHLVDKVFAKISNEESGWQSKFIPRLLMTVFYDLVTEEMWDIIKKHNDPKIDFRYLRNLTIAKVKELKSEVF